MELSISEGNINIINKS